MAKNATQIKSTQAEKNQNGSKQTGWPQRLLQFTRKVAFASPVYSAILNGQTPLHLAQSPRDAFAGDIHAGNQIMRGVFPLAGREYPVSLHGRAIGLWNAQLPPLAYEELHSFRWLRHLHAVGGNAARQTARQLLEDWFVAFNGWDEKSWRPDLIGERLTAWLSQYAFFGSSADDHFRIQFFQSLMRQLRHLVRVYEQDTSGYPRLCAVKGLLFCAYALGDDYLDMPPVIAELQDAIHSQILPDGCYVNRSPASQARVLQDLIEIRSLFTYAQLPLPEGLGEAIAAMARALRHLRHGDGGLGLFHGSFEDNPDLLDLLLVTSNVKGKPGDVLDDGGWHRLQTNRSLIILDAGNRRGGNDAPPNNISDCAANHNSPLAMEFSTGKERVIVNCGSGFALDQNWIDACQSPSAHSGLYLNDFPLADEYRVMAERKSAEGHLWFSASHDGYKNAGIRHTRRIYMNILGDDIRGEDILERAGGHMPDPVNFTIRFHLHPKIQSIEAQNSVILRGSSGSGWRLRISGGKLRLENSVYLGQKGQVQKTRQIVIAGELLNDSSTVKWAIQKEGKK